MQQYGSYPIFINTPPEAVTAAREKLLAEHGAKNNFRETARLRNVQKLLDDITIDPAPTAMARAFEKEVSKHLDFIASSPIGRVTLDSLNANEKLWIIPTSPQELKDNCKSCAAYVTPAKPEAGGGIRLYYIPEEQVISGKWTISTDDTLYHELVHALRVGWGSSEKDDWINDYQDKEEFIATIMENMYRSSRKQNTFYSRYLQPSEMLSKEKLYDRYSKDETLINWFKRCTFSDSFIWAMARRVDPPFNPWRDRPELEKRWVKANRKRGITKFPGS